MSTVTISFPEPVDADHAAKVHDQILFLLAHGHTATEIGAFASLMTDAAIDTDDDLPPCAEAR